MGCKMVQVENQYAKAHEYLAATDWREAYKLDQFLLPVLKLQAYAFRDGALRQVLACVADLRIWAGQFSSLGKEEIARELEQFAKDWEEEAKGYYVVEGLSQRDGDDSKKP